MFFGQTAIIIFQYFVNVEINLGNELFFFSEFVAHGNVLKQSKNHLSHLTFNR